MGLPDIKTIDQTKILAGDIALWAECLPSIQEVLGFKLHHCINQACSNPSIWEMEKGGSDIQGHSWLHSKFMASLGYMESHLKREGKERNTMA